jgi:NADH dehydrogenase
MAWMMVGVAFACLVLAGLVIAAGRRMVVSPMVNVPDRTRARPRIVIVGGGFGGIYTARYLERALHARDDFEIVLINRENYFVFQPMLPEVISGSIGIVDTVSPIRRLLPNTELHVREVESIDLDDRVVRLSAGFEPRPTAVPFDHLVLALGNVTDFRNLHGLSEHALPFKNLADALALRSHIIAALEEAAVEPSESPLRRQLLTFVVAGGGFSGVEIVAEVNDFVRGVARYYRGIDRSEIRVILLHGQERILPEVSEKLALFAQRILQKRGVELRLRDRLLAATSEGAVTSMGPIPTKTLVATVPSSPHPLVAALDVAKEKNGRVSVEGSLRVRGSERIWALGDCAWVTTPDGRACPPTAQFATRQARTLATNLVATLRGGTHQRFAFAELGKMGSLGHRSAVAEIMGVSLSGFLAWFLWRTIYLAKLPGWGRRLKVAAAWTLDLLLPPDLVELRLSPSVGIVQEHFEPGQTIFHQGDLGDRVYMILHGEVEVVREEPTREVVLGRLGCGQYFGEMALLENTQRNATVRSLSHLDVMSVPKREFGLLAAYLPGLRQSVEATARDRATTTSQLSETH